MLVVNADDLGLTTGINRGIAEAALDGIVTSASLLVTGPGAGGALAPGLDLGLHVDLSRWRRGGEYALPGADAVAAEVERQLALFERLAGRSPTHLDSHHHVHRAEAVARTVLAAAARRLRVPLRFGGDIHVCTDFYGRPPEGSPEAITVDALLELLERLPAGASELVCHPGHVDGSLRSTYRDERERELRTLCDPRVRAAVGSLGIRLVAVEALRV